MINDNNDSRPDIDNNIHLNYKYLTNQIVKYLRLCIQIRILNSFEKKPD